MSISAPHFGQCFIGKHLTEAHFVSSKTRQPWRISTNASGHIANLSLSSRCSQYLHDIEAVPFDRIVYCRCDCRAFTCSFLRYRYGAISRLFLIKAFTELIVLPIDWLIWIDELPSFHIFAASIFSFSVHLAFGDLTPAFLHQILIVFSDTPSSIATLSIGAPFLTLLTHLTTVFDPYIDTHPCTVSHPHNYTKLISVLSIRLYK